MDENSYSPLVLAYIGDSVYEVIIRTKVINRGSMQVNKMHKQSSELVKAGTQAELIKAIEDMLTQEEHAVFKRGRNAKSATSAKNASVIDYRMATGMRIGLDGGRYWSPVSHSRLYSCPSAPCEMVTLRNTTQVI